MQEIPLCGHKLHREALRAGSLAGLRAEERERFQANFPCAEDAKWVLDSPEPNCETTPIQWVLFKLHSARYALSETLTGEARGYLLEIEQLWPLLPEPVRAALPPDSPERCHEIRLAIWMGAYADALGMLNQYASEVPTEASHRG